MPATILGEHALTLPVGSTAQRPSSPTSGMIRQNSTTGVNETFDGTGWQSFDEFAHTNIQAFTSSGSFTVPAGVRRLQVLVVAGGGGGGAFYYAGGGGAGGLIFDRDYKVTPGQVITATVGAGAAAVSQGGVHGNKGSDSIFGTLKAIGGGGGGASNQPPGSSGGSGGGANDIFRNGGGGSAGSQGSSGANANRGGGGGGGAGMPGFMSATRTNTNQLPNGGDGLYIQLFSAYGASGYFAGGGGGAYDANLRTDNARSSGGLGGGGGGGGWSAGGLQPTAGAANTGGGGGGGMHDGNSSGTGAAGGSGVILVAWYQ